MNFSGLFDINTELKKSILQMLNVLSVIFTKQ